MDILEVYDWHNKHKHAQGPAIHNCWSLVYDSFAVSEEKGNFNILPYGPKLNYATLLCWFSLDIRSALITSI